MNRQYLLSLEESRAYRNVTWADTDDRDTVRVEAPEIRANKDGTTLTYFGHASITERSYTVYGGAPFGWDETIARGAFKRTLLNNADVNFLVNHEGPSLARTKSGTLTLDEDAQGLRAMADFDPESPAVQTLYSAVRRGDMDEMSFGFRVVADEWTDSDGEPASNLDGVNRRILEVSLNKGDVSAVNYGANPATSGGFRDLDRALTELRAGKALTDEQRALLRSFAAGIEQTTPVPQPKRLIAARLQELDRIAAA